MAMYWSMAMTMAPVRQKDDTPHESADKEPGDYGEDESLAETIARPIHDYDHSRWLKTDWRGMDVGCIGYPMVTKMIGVRVVVRMILVMVVVT